MSMLLDAFPDEYNKNIDEKIMESYLDNVKPFLSYTNTLTSAQRQIMAAAYSNFGAMGTWQDGTAIPTDEAKLRFTETFTMVFYGLGFKVSRKHVQYGDLILIQDWANSLGQSAAETMCVAGAAALNNAFATTLGDGVVLISASHPTAGTVQSNIVGAAALSPTTLEALRVSMANRLDYRGKRKTERLQNLILPVALEKTAKEITQSLLAPYTTDNQTNTHNGINIIVDPYLTSATAFFGQARNHKLNCYIGQAVKNGNFIEDSTESIVKYLSADFVFGVADWYGMAGCAGA
jgi:hypothetical protein